MTDSGEVYSSRQSSTTSLASTSDAGPSLSSLKLQDEEPATPRRRPMHPQRSPSSPNLPLSQERPPLQSAGTLSRSRTLPFRIPSSSQSKIPTLDGVSLEDGKIERLRRWILGLAIVNFDLELGPVLACIFPDLQLFPFEAENIAFSAFPDSAQFEEGSQIHSFRIREGKLTLHSDDPRPVSPDGFIYAFSHFSRRKDPSFKRGYEQRSIVILTHQPYPALWHSVLSKLGPLYQTHGEPILEVASHNIANWSAPLPGRTIELGFLGSVMHAEIPETLDEQQLSNTAHLHSQTDQDWHILACAPPSTPPPLTLFEASLPHLWSIWECLVLCEPILVFGPSPAMTSQAVWWLRDLFRPIPWPSDFRPYFTIHDKEHNALVNDMPPKAGLLLGVTNPYFERACKHWPHVLSLGRTRPKKPKERSVNVTGPPPGWRTSTHRRYISKDRQLLQQMEDACRGEPRAQEEASTALRRHFSSRTAALLVPLNRYLNTLIPSPSETLRGWPAAARLKPFNNANFLASLKAHGTPLPFRSSSKQREFYEKWLRTPAFGLWLANREETVARVLKETAECGVGGMQ